MDVDIINQDVEKYKNYLINEYHNGTLSIVDVGNTAPPLEIEDEMHAQVLDICFRALPKLVRKQGVTFRHASFPGNIELKLIDEYVHISSTYSSASKFLKTELFSALYGCGLKYIHLLYRLTENGGNYTKDIKIFEYEAQLAKKTLEGQNLV
ncbi:MAG: hypothetical protein GY797_16825 [Deltaproteobacteria bacterium]|nr:hypothetical protein [Deltaproteobacteria bacterium]